MMCVASLIFTLIVHTVAIYGSNCPNRESIAQSLERVRIPGAAIVVINTTHTLYEQAFGYRSLSPNEPMDIDKSIFALASISKTFIAAAVMQLVEQERIDLDTDINQYLSEPNRRIFHPQYPLHSITLRKLLSHSASIAVPSEVQNTYYQPGDSAYTNDSLAETCFKYVNPNTSYWLPKPPGSVASYSNEGSALAALVVERVTQMPYIDYVKENILKPLGVDMSKVGVRLADFANTDDLVKHYTYAFNATFLPGWNQQIPGLNLTQLPGDLPNWLFIDHFGFNLYPSGLLRMSARTLSVYLRMFLNNGSNILSARSIAEMRTVVGGGLIPNYQSSNNSSTGQSPPSEFGISWYWLTNTNGRRYIGHSGSLPGAVHLMLVDEKQTVGVIVLTNGDTNPPTDLSRQISETIRNIHVSLFECFEINASSNTSTSSTSSTPSSATSTNAPPTSTTAGSSRQKVRSSVLFVVIVLFFLF